MQYCHLLCITWWVINKYTNLHNVYDIRKAQEIFEKMKAPGNQ